MLKMFGQVQSETGESIRSQLNEDGRVRRALDRTIFARLRGKTGDALTCVFECEDFVGGVIF